jgi:hypothetical protein
MINNLYYEKYIKYKAKYIQLKEQIGGTFSAGNIWTAGTRKTKNVLIQLLLIGILFSIKTKNIQLDVSFDANIDELLDDSFIFIAEKIIQHVRLLKSDRYVSTQESDPMALIGISNDISNIDQVSDIYPHFNNKPVTVNGKEIGGNHHYTPRQNSHIYGDNVSEIISSIQTHVTEYTKKLILYLIGCFIKQENSWDTIKNRAIGWLYWAYPRSIKLRNLFDKYYFKKETQSIPKPKIHMYQNAQQIIEDWQVKKYEYSTQIINIFWKPEKSSDKISHFLENKDSTSMESTDETIYEVFVSKIKLGSIFPVNFTSMYSTTSNLYYNELIKLLIENPENIYIEMCEKNKKEIAETDSVAALDSVVETDSVTETDSVATSGSVIASKSKKSQITSEVFNIEVENPDVISYFSDFINLNALNSSSDEYNKKFYSLILPMYFALKPEILEYFIKISTQEKQEKKKSKTAFDTIVLQKLKDRIKQIKPKDLISAGIKSTEKTFIKTHTLKDDTFIKNDFLRIELKNKLQ